MNPTDSAMMIDMWRKLNADTLDHLDATEASLDTCERACKSAEDALHTSRQLNVAQDELVGLLYRKVARLELANSQLQRLNASLLSSRIW